uniref:CAP-Gly domain-containing protein n=1 Tax=Onchocerca volvulus TaxID=6282 RepID=A0A8R1TYF8_ONCVO
MTESKATGGLIRSNSKESIISAISHVGDWEIGDRCQIGGRIGNIVYIGPARFAPGEWIGIVLDQPLGKNDGSVDGHRYFSCEPNHGLFCKASKLERVESPSPSTEVSQNNPFCKEYGVEIGDRVIVSGGKCGRLRFLGKTDFKDGVWAGVELDQPVGKNDGSVQGKRYFTCKAPYGLFAAASKVIRAPDQTSAKFKIRHTKTSALRLRSGSHESLSSIGGASSIASSRISKYNFATPRSIQRPLIISSARGQEDLFKTIQESLKEKETHLEQMIRERDIERNEMASLSNRCELAEAKATQLETAKTLVDQQLEALKVMLDESEAKFKTADSTVNDLTVQLKEKKDALEDLTFRYDEETILNAEMAEKIAELERRTVVKENENADTSKVLINEMEQIKLQLEELKKQCSAFEQEKLSICTGMKNILSACKQDFTELIQLLSSNDTIGSVNENETAAINDDQDLSKQMETNMKKLSSLLDYNKAVKKAIQEKLESNKEEIRNLASQLETLKKSMNDQTIITSQKDDELAICQTNVDQLRNELEKVERSKEKLKETCDALEISNNVLLENFDHLNKKDTEMAEKMENERKEYDAEITKLKEELWRAQNDAIQIKEQLHEMEAEKAKLMELRESLENSNRELLMDKESLESQKIELGGELRQKELERETLNSFLAKKEMELASTKSKIDDLSGQVDRLRANLCEASSSDESLKKELESLREENKKEAEAHSVQAAQLQINNESLEKELLATRNNFQSLENIHSAMKNTLGKTESELQKLREMFSSSQQELVAEQEKVAKLQQEIVSHVSAVEHLQRLQKEEAASHAQTQSKLQSENDTTQKKLHDLEVDKEILLKEKTELQKEVHAKVAERYQALTQSLKDRVSLDSDYKEKVRKLEAKLKKLYIQIPSLITIFSISECLSTVDCKGESLEEKIDNLLEERIHLIDAEKRLKVEIEELMAEKEKQASDLTMTVAKLSEFEQERNALAVSLNRLEKERKDKDAEFSVLKNELINIKDENKNKEDIINSLEAEVNIFNNKRLEKERNDKDAELNVLKTEMINLTNDNKNKDSIINSLEAEVTMSKKENESLCQRISKLMADLSALNANSANNDRITEKELDITTVNVTQNEQYEEEINTLREEKNQAISQINVLKLEILELSKKQAENEEMVSEAKQRSALFIDFEEEWKNKETAYMQEIQELKIAVGKTETDKIEEMKRDISFLNSIIAEQYKKEKDLKDQITILNSLPANEIMTELQRKTTQEVSLRLYCDICEVFDLHDTTDCPAQAMAVEDEAIHQKTKKAKPPARPYCEQCEEFEHDTSS